MKKAIQVDTRNRLLDVAEEHFALYGFAGTTLRGIVKSADANVAAIAYHFGSKEDLFIEVIKRFAQPVVEKQLQSLQNEMARKERSLEGVLKAFYEAPLVLIESMGEKGDSLSLFLGKTQTETGAVFDLVDKNFAQCRDQFIAAFRLLSPSLSEEDHQWNFEFMLSLIVCFLNRQAPIRRRYGDTTKWKSEEVSNRLVNFCCNGFSTRTP